MNIALGNDHGVVCRIGRGKRKLLSEALDMPQKHLVSDTHNADAIVVRLNTFPHQNERAFNDVIPVMQSPSTCMKKHSPEDTSFAETGMYSVIFSSASIGKPA